MPKIDYEIKLDFKDVLIRPKRSKLKSRKDVSLIREYIFVNSKQNWKGIPIISANMDTTGTFEIAKIFSKYNCITAIHKHYHIDEWKRIKKEHPELLKHIAVSSGISNNDLEKLKKIIIECPEIKIICLDVANGYSEYFVNFVKKTRELFPNHIIIAGNVVTGEMTEQLILNGADIVKVGIGPGSVCTTRKKTGIGYPQLSAVIECADAAHGLGGHIISDGGCTMAGDFSKAFGGGADFVMAGGIFAGHDESGGEIIEKNGKKFKEFYGMSSATAMKKYNGKVADYRASEGKKILMEYKGPIEETLKTILGGIRSTCTYVGAQKLKELSKRTTFIRINSHHNTIYGDEK